MDSSKMISMLLEVFQLQHVFSQTQLVHMQLAAGSSRSLIGCTLVVRFVALLWALLILQLIMVVGSHHELSHLVSDCKIVHSCFENRSRDAKVVRPHSAKIFLSFSR